MEKILSEIKISLAKIEVHQDHMRQDIAEIKADNADTKKAVQKNASFRVSLIAWCAGALSIFEIAGC